MQIDRAGGREGRADERQGVLLHLRVGPPRVLGALLLDPPSLGIVSGLLHPQDFVVRAP